MIKTSVVFVWALSALAQDSVPIQFHSLAPSAQQNPGRGLPPFGAPGPLGKQQGFFRIDQIDSLMLRFNAVAEPPLENPGGLKLAWVVNKALNVWHRFVIDKIHQQYFGYDLSVKPATGGEYRITFGPPSTVPDGLAYLDGAAALSPVPLPKYPDSQLVKSGDTIALDLLVSPDGKQKIVDYIQFTSAPPADPPVAISTEEPRDFTLDDGPVTTDFAGFILINGQKFQGVTWFDKKPGATMWFSFPGQGRYILSLAPHDGFLKLGAIRDNVISFQSDGQQYEVRMKNSMVNSGGAWNLYVLHDRSYQPEKTAQQMIPGGVPAGMPTVIGGTDRLDNLLPNQ